LETPSDFFDHLADTYKELSDDFKIQHGMKSPRVRKMTPVKYKKALVAAAANKENPTLSA
jgi:hypothetical protein